MRLLNKLERRALLRQSFVRVWPSPVKHEKKIAVFGLPRSGTSWLAKAISLSNGVSYYFEPDHCLDKDYWYKYLDVDDTDSLLSEFVTKSLSGKIVDEYVIAEQGLSELVRRPYAKTLLVKYVKLSLCLDWYAKNFSDVKIVQIVRNPIPLFLSWRVRNWDPAYALATLLRQEKLVSGPLREFYVQLKYASTFWECAGAFWGAVTFMQLSAHRTGWILHEHEWFCIDPVAHFKLLFQQLELQWNDNVESFLLGKNGDTTGPGYGKWRDPRTELDKWRKDVSKSDIDEAQKYIAMFNLPFFPDLNSTSFWDGNPLNPN